MSLRSVQSPNIFRVLQENTLFFIYNQGFSSKLKKLSAKLKVSKDPVTLFDDKWLKRKLIYLFTKQIKHFAQPMLSRARPIYRNIGKGGICHSWQKHSKATKEKTQCSNTVCCNKREHSTYEVESHTIYSPSKILSQPNSLCAVTKMVNLEITNEQKHVLEHKHSLEVHEVKIKSKQQY